MSVRIAAVLWTKSGIQLVILAVSDNASDCFHLVGGF